MTCNDCIHFDLCIPVYSKIFGKGNGLDAEAETDGCGYFKDRSRFVELPCKLGDTIYTVSLKYGILPWSVFGICSAIDEWSATPRITLLACSTKLGRNAKFSAKMLNASVFLTHEEAEQALKERENNG